jgi:hypothetical protein
LWRFKELLAEIGHPASAVAKIIEENLADDENS